MSGEPERMPIKVSQNVADGINAVRESGLVNMFDRSGFIQLASQMGFAEASDWAARHQREYSQLIFNGLEVTNG